MAPPPVIITGWSSTSKVPGVVAEVVYGAGPINAASIPLICLLIGLQLATGAATANQDVNLLTNADTAAALYDDRSELANMAYKALGVAGVNLYGAGVPEAGGAVAGSLTVTITGTPTAQGTLQYWIGGRYVTVSFTTTDTPTTIAVSLKNAVNGNTRWPFTSGNVAGVNTITTISKGVRANDYIAFQDVTKAAGTGIVSTLGGGGAAVTGGGLHFFGGTGADSVATLLPILFPGTYDFIAAAQYDVTNAALFLTHSQQKAGPLEMRPTRVVFGYQSTLTNAVTLAQTTLNDQRSAVLWCLNCESVPSEIAAVGASMRAAASQNDPGASFDGLAMPGIVPQRAKADWAQRATQESALASGVTPLSTVNNQVQIVRAIGTHSLTGVLPDYRTLDWGDDYVPDFIRKDASLYWQTEYVLSNPRVADDPDPTQRDLPAGVATPTRWNQILTGRLLGYELRGPIGPLPLLMNTALHPPTSGYDKIARRIVSLVPIEVLSGNHQCGLSIRQIVPT